MKFEPVGQKKSTPIQDLFFKKRKAERRRSEQMIREGYALMLREQDKRKENSMWQMNVTRPVEWRDFSRSPWCGIPELRKASFHQWGSGSGGNATAIIEFPDGSVENVPVEQIRFLDRKG